MGEYIFTHPVLIGLRKANKVSNARIEDGFIRIHYWKAFLSGGIEINADEPNAEEKIVTRCHLELQKEKRDLAKEVTVLYGQVGAKEKAYQRATELLNELPFQ